jgi:putative DNA primase/helicase
LPSVQPYANDLLPPILHDFVSDVSHRMQCPPDFVAVALVVAVSSLIGARKVVCPKVNDPWQVVPNLWGAVVARAGMKKSPALSEVLKPIQKLETKHREAYAIQYAEWKIRDELAKAKHSRVKASISKEGFEGTDEQAMKMLSDASPPDKPVLQRTLVNDATVEKLGVILEGNPDGLLVFRDELYSLLRDLDRPGQESSRGFYLTAFDGDKPYVVERMSREEVHIDRLCFSLLGGIQPSRLNEYVAQAITGGAGDDGLMQRFSVLVWPDVDTDTSYVDQAPNFGAAEDVRLLFAKLGALPPRGAGEASIMRFSPNAQVLYAQWAAQFDRLLINDEIAPAMVSHLSKYRKLIPSLALIFSMVEKVVQDDLIELHHLQMALHWVGYLRSHAERVYSASLRPELRAAKLLLSKIQKGQAFDENGSLSARHIERKNWSGLSDSATVGAAIKLLEWHDYIRAVKIAPVASKGGRPSIVYQVNPKFGLVKGGFNNAAK